MACALKQDIEAGDGSGNISGLLGGFKRAILIRFLRASGKSLNDLEVFIWPGDLLATKRLIGIYGNSRKGLESGSTNKTGWNTFERPRNVWCGVVLRLYYGSTEIRRSKTPEVLGSNMFTTCVWGLMLRRSSPRRSLLRGLTANCVVLPESLPGPTTTEATRVFPAAAVPISPLDDPTM